MQFIGRSLCVGTRIRAAGSGIGVLCCALAFGSQRRWFGGHRIATARASRSSTSSLTLRLPGCWRTCNIHPDAVFARTASTAARPGNTFTPTKCHALQCCQLSSEPRRSRAGHQHRMPVGKVGQPPPFTSASSAPWRSAAADGGCRGVALRIEVAPHHPGLVVKVDQMLRAARARPTTPAAPRRSISVCASLGKQAMRRRREFRPYAVARSTVAVRSALASWLKSAATAPSRPMGLPSARTRPARGA